MKSPSSLVSYRSLILVTLPAMFAVVLEPMAEMIDTAVLGHESTLWVAGLAATNACLGSFAWVFNFLSYGVTAQIAHSYGAKRPEDVGAHIRAGLAIALAIGIGVGAVLLFAGEWFLVDVMGTEGELYHTAYDYYAIRVLGYPLTILSLSLIGILRGIQQIRFSGLVVLVMTVVNGIGTYVSVFYLDMGIRGAAMATVFSFLIGDLLILGRLYVDRDSLGLSGRWRVAWQDVLSLGTDGINLAGRTGVLTLAFFLLTACATRLGVTVVAAHQVALQLWLLAAFLIDGLSITATTVGGRLVGEKNTVALRLMAQRLLVLGLIIGLFFCVAYLSAERMLIGLYTDQPDIWNMVAGIWILIAVTQPINAVAYVLDGILFAFRDFVFLRRRMLEGFVLCFLPALYYGFAVTESLLGLWLALVALNTYRGVSGWFGVRKALASR